MQEHNLQSMTDLVIEDLSKSCTLPDNAGETILKAMQKHWGDKIAIVWGTDDVHSIAPSPITEEQAMDTLVRARDRHDANEGVNWIILGIHLDTVTGT